MPLRILLIAFSLCLSAGAAVEFIPPDPTKSLFRRDQLPIDPDTMRSLSAQLSILAGRPAEMEPAQLRATAQLLALAGRLDPANPRVRALTEFYSSNQNPPAANTAKLAHAKSQTWRILNWLQQEEAGVDGRRLAAQLLDALRVIDPQHAIPDHHDPAGEHRRWNGVVAPLHRFAGTHPEPPIEKPQPELDTPPETPKPSGPPIQIREGTLRTPLYVFGKNYKQVLRVVPLSYQIHQSDVAGTLTFRLNPTFKSPTHQAAQAQVQGALLTLWPRLPEQEFAILNTSGQRYASRNGTALSGSAALLLHSALSGKPLRKDLLFIGEVQSDASLKAPNSSWDYLSTLRNEPGGRLLVPPDMQDQLLGLLVLHGPEVFLKYEILAVSTLDKALNIGSTHEDSLRLATASTIFADIQKAAKDRDLGPLLALDSVRERLATIQTHTPNHLSATMLLRYGDSKNHPIRLPRTILALEVVRALAPLSWITRPDLRNLTSAHVLASYENSRERLVALQKYINVDDQVFLGKARDLADLFRPLARELQKTGANLSDPSSPASKILAQIRQDYDSFRRAAATASGHPLPELASPQDK